MERIKLRIHPLFLLVGVLSCLVGKLLLFLTFTLSALLHECAHAFTAARFGYRLNEILLLPYGAAVKGDLFQIGKREELIVDLSGPLVSGGIALAVLALWWLFPACYPYTADIFYANRVLCLSNLLPVYPLDGGRISRIAFISLFGKKRGEILSRVLGGIAALIACIYCGYRKDILSLLFCFSLFFGLFSVAEYEAIPFRSISSLKRGVPVLRVAIEEHAKLKILLRFFSPERYLFFDVYSSQGRFLFTCRQEQVEELFLAKGISAEIGEISVGKT